MAIFKVGQRVRIVRGSKSGRGPSCVGREATIIDYVAQIRYVSGEVKEAYFLAIDGIGTHNPVHGDPYAAEGSWLAPLTDPKADEFIERLKKLEREPQPLVTA